MLRVALAVLRYDRWRTSLLIMALGATWALVIVQLGLRRGFEQSARAVVDHVGGDTWLVAKGVRVLDDGEPLPPLAVPPACVRAQRPVVVDYAQVRRPDGSLTTVQIVGVDAASATGVPWGVVAGDARALAEPMMVGIDEADASKLGLPDGGTGRDVVLRDGTKLRVRSVSRGARSFTQTPFLFVDVKTARGLAGLRSAEATFWAVDSTGAGCGEEVARAAEAVGARAVEREELASSTARHWVDDSGIGTLLTAGCVLSALVGAAALFQSVLTMLRTHAKEIATLRALGARRSDLSAFVGWLIGSVSVGAGCLALSVAIGCGWMLRGAGLIVVVDRSSALAGLVVAVISTGVAAFWGGRALAKIDPRTVLE